MSNNYQLLISIQEYLLASRCGFSTPEYLLADHSTFGVGWMEIGQLDLQLLFKNIGA